MIEGTLFLLLAAALFVAGAAWDRRRSRRLRSHAHRTWGSRVGAWAIRAGILASTDDSVRLSAVDEDMRRRGY